jgi:hypothetical protein
VDSTQLTAEQAADLAAHVAPITGYLTRLYDRMQKRGWIRGDPLYEDVRAAQNALHRLHVTVREVERLRRMAATGRRPWEPGGSGRE